MVYNPFNPLTKIIASRVVPAIKVQTKKFTSPPLMKGVSPEVSRPRVARPLREPSKPVLSGLSITNLGFGDVDTSSFPKSGGGSLPTSKATRERMAAALKAAYTRPGFSSTYNYQTGRYELTPIPGKESQMTAKDKILSKFNYRGSEYEFKSEPKLSPSIKERLLRGFTASVSLSPSSRRDKKRMLVGGGLAAGTGGLIAASGYLKKGSTGLDPNFVNQPSNLNPLITEGPFSTVGSSGGGSRPFEVSDPILSDSTKFQSVGEASKSNAGGFDKPSSGRNRGYSGYDPRFFGGARPPPSKYPDKLSNNFNKISNKTNRIKWL